MGLNWLLFLQLSNFSKDMKHAIGMKWIPNPHPGVATFLIIFKTHKHINMSIFISILSAKFVTHLYVNIHNCRRNCNTRNVKIYWLKKLKNNKCDIHAYKKRVPLKPNVHKYISFPL